MHSAPEPSGRLDCSQHPFVAELLERCDFGPVGTAVRCGVSGGADSLSLLVLATCAGLEVTAIHVDHGLRSESAAEAEVVRAAAQRFGCGFESVRVEVADGANLEARAREARHTVLGPDALLGHTADDQAETLLINLLRGAGPDGLAAMRSGHRRPLLGLRRAETEQLCVELGLDPVNDPSNADPRFVRNRVRHEVLPLLREVSGRDPVPLLNRTSAHARELVDGLSSLAIDLDATSTRALRAAPAVIGRSALRNWLQSERGYPPSTAELDRLWDVVEHRTVACELAGGQRVTRTAGRLRLGH